MCFNRNFSLNITVFIHYWHLNCIEMLPRCHILYYTFWTRANLWNTLFDKSNICITRSICANNIFSSVWEAFDLLLWSYRADLWEISFTVLWGNTSLCFGLVWTLCWCFPVFSPLCFSRFLVLFVLREFFGLCLVFLMLSQLCSNTVLFCCFDCLSI